MAFLLKHTENFLMEQERKVVPEIQKILTKERRNATSKLYNSFEIEIIDKPRNTGFEVKLYYAEHGKYVLDNRRRFNKQHPSKLAIQSIMQWIGNKGISIGGGKIRSVMGTSTAKAKSDTIESKKRSFAYAIWYANKRRGRTWAQSTNFLKPWNNLYKSSDFQQGLTHSFAMDLGAQFKPLFKNNKININM